jgi:membrane fusion protein (multidrug efflux system)
VQSIYQVAVVTLDNKANFRVVKVGNQVGTDWIITDGLKSNEKVIVQGFMKVREGTPVDAKPFVAAPAEAN